MVVKFPQPQYDIMTKGIQRIIYYDSFDDFNVQNVGENSIIVFDDYAQDLSNSKIIFELLNDTRHKKISLITLSPVMFRLGKESCKQRKACNFILVMRSAYSEAATLLSQLDQNLIKESDRQAKMFVQNTPFAGMLVDLRASRLPNSPLVYGLKFRPIA